MSINPFASRNHTPPGPTATETSVAVQDYLAERLERLQDLVDATEALVQQARNLVLADANIGRSFASAAIRPWRDRAMSLRAQLHDLIMTSLPALRACRELLEAGEGRLAAQEHGQLIREIRSITAALGAVKRERPDPIARVGLHLTPRLQRKPSNDAATVLELIFPPSTADLGEVNLTDITDRLRLDDLPTDVLFFGGHALWDSPVLIANLEQQPVPA